MRPLQLILTGLAFGFILTGCAKTIQPVVDQITGQVAIEQKKVADKVLAQVKCQEFCQEKVSLGDTDFSRGPCLSNAIAPDWVCDMAHSPRQAIDDDPANQCESFRRGETHHFVEVDGNCNIIKAQ